ncbi:MULTISPECIES: hypothetical protein [Microbacterium]|uniref:hypothetical protein n=1 Tax=Microbacterium TaxID=33882 RepID=UPI00278A7796|nr:MULTISPECIES: hypothetical protein [Microbacterium]MDQ1084616.1 hypothetical protein [Microbacterium sp. SORGH_AS_0344]MDQ1170107.1 hypothetical protein [Microbacterium proteolyticum]
MSPEYLRNAWTRMLQSSPSEVIWGLLSSTLICIALGAVIALLLTRVRRGRRSADSASQADRVALGAISLVVAAVWIGDIALRGYAFDMSATVSWWRFALAPTVAAAGLAVWVVTRRTAQPRRTLDAASATRRTWTTFGPHRGIRVLAAAVAVTGGIVVVFGRMSTALDPGLSAHIAWEVPNVAAPPIVMVFPGWAYGIPMLAGVVALGAGVVLALHRNALRPYSDGARLDLERSGRSDVARDIVALGVATVLVVLGGMLHMARSAATTSMTVVMESGREETVDVALPHADLIMAGGLAAPILEIAGCVLLTLLVLRAAAIVSARHRFPARLVEAAT